MSMKRRMALIILSMMLIASFPLMSMAQDEVPTEEPTSIATVEPTAVETAAPTAEVTVEPVPATVVPPTDTPPVEPPPAPVPSTGMDPNMVFIGLVLLLLVFGLANQFTGYKLGKELAKAIPPEWLPVVQNAANTAQRIVYERAGAFADSTESPIDNNILDEQMKQAGWEFYIDLTTGVRHARQKSVIVAQGDAGGGSSFNG